MAKECASTMFPYCDEHLYGIQSSCHHPIMNPIIVNNESYFQFTMNAIACPLPPRLHFSNPWDCRRKTVTRGEGMQGRQAQRGMVCLQIGCPSQSINQRMAPIERPLGTEKQARPQRTCLKKWSSSAELLHLSCGLSIQFPRHPVLRIFHFEARIG